MLKHDTAKQFWTLEDKQFFSVGVRYTLVAPLGLEFFVLMRLYTRSRSLSHSLYTRLIPRGLHKLPKEFHLELTTKIGFRTITLLDMSFQTISQ